MNIPQNTNGQATMANSQPVVLASNQASIPVAATLSAETTKVVGTVNIAAGQTVAAVTAITNALPAGTNLLGKVGIDQTTPGTTNKVAISDALGNSTSATPYARFQVELNPHQIFYDPFDSTLDATDRWTTPTVGNSAVLASNTAGSMSMGTGVVASGWSKLTSQNSFTPTVPGWIGYSFLNLFPDLAAPSANAYRFWGAGTIAAVPTTAAPMTDAIGFEISTAGKMFAVVYTAGARTAVQDLSAATGNSTQPTDALLHRYIVKIRTDRVYFYIDGESSAQLVATFSATTATSGPSVQTLPISFVAVGGSTPPASNTQIQSLGAVVWDASQNNNTLSDGNFQWRKATVKKASTPAVAADTALVVGLPPNNSAIPAWGHGATAAAVPSGANYQGLIAKTSLPAAAADANLVGGMADKFGRSVAILGTIRDLVGTQTTTISASTVETTIVTAGGAGVFTDLVMLIISNTSASTSTRIDFRDVAAGTILFSLQSVGGAAPVGFALTVPIPQTTANSAWTAQCATSTTDVRIYAVYQKNK